MKIKKKRLLFLSIFLMLFLPISSLEILSSSNQERLTEKLNNKLAKTSLKLNSDEEKTELIIKDIGFNSKVKRKDSGNYLLLEIHTFDKPNLISDFQSISLPKYGV